jgi:hypothetical protein
MLLCLGLAVGLSLQQLVIPPTGTMDSYEHPFAIELGGAYVAEVESNFEGQIPARIGPNPAIFTLKNGCLSSGPWVMGRAMVENKSAHPKEVYWFNETTPVERGIPDPSWRDYHSVTAQHNGESIKLLFSYAGTNAHFEMLNLEACA